MDVEILCSSRELFGADRCALRLAEVLKSIGLSPWLVVPANRPELGLADEAAKRGIAYHKHNVTIASSKGIEAPFAVFSQRDVGGADLTIFNSTAVVGSKIRVKKKVVIVREWLEPSSMRHRVLALRHRVGADAVVGISTGVISQWRSCVRGPRQQFLVHDWLERDFLDAARRSVTDSENGSKRVGILCIGRFNNWKGQEILADAYEQAFVSTDERPPLRFVGAQQGTKFADLSDALKIRGNDWGWEVLPFVPDPADYFRKSALVVVPSLKPEPFGMIMLEALAYGCRVLAFEGGGPSDLAVDFPNVVKTVKRDTQALARALAIWWKNGGLALTGIERADAWKILDLRYSPEIRAENWHAIIDAVAT
jgi:glycosyltransferase involved in cell wall biosynthesis